MKIKAKMKAKKAAVKAKMAARKAAIKSRLKDVCAVLFAALCASWLSGCAFERADPAARSNRTTYDLNIVASGDHASVNCTFGDGTVASADGAGAVTQPSTLTTEQSPDVSVPGDALSAGIQAVGHITGKAIDAYSASKTSGAKSGGDCTGGDCELNTADCSDGSCELK